MPRLHSSKELMAFTFSSLFKKDSTKAKGFCFTTKDVEDLEKTSEEEDFLGVDILVSFFWPQDVTQYAHQPSVGENCWAKSSVNSNSGLTHIT